MEGTKLNSSPVLRCDRLSRRRSVAKIRHSPRPEALPELASLLARAARKLFLPALPAALKPEGWPLVQQKIPPSAGRTRYRTRYRRRRWPRILNSTWRLHAAALRLRI